MTGTDWVLIINAVFTGLNTLMITALTRLIQKPSAPD